MNPITPLTPAEEAKVEQEDAHESFGKRVAIAIDDLGNVLICNGENDETISAHASRAAVAGKQWGILLSKALDLISKDHGAKAQAGDLERAKVVESLETGNGILPE